MGSGPTAPRRPTAPSSHTEGSSWHRRARRIGCAWPAAGAVLGVAGVALLAGIGAAARPGRLALLAATPALVRVALPTSTPTSPAPTPTLPEPTAIPAGGGGGVSLGDLVEIFGTDGEGVRLRQVPGLNGAILALATDSEVFEVREGPVEASGYVWWNLVNPYNPDRSGWAVVNFLRPLPGY